jgi:hypothetical protein
MGRLKIKVRQLERELGSLKIKSSDEQSISTLESLLKDANEAREKYRADFLATRRETLKLEAQLDYIRSGKGDDPDP